MADQPPPDQDTAMSDADKVHQLPSCPSKRPADGDVAQIRAKRLAKLGGSTNSAGPSRPSSTGPEAPASGSSTPKPAEAQTSAPAPAPQPQNPLPQVETKPQEKPRTQINIKPKPVDPPSRSTTPQSAHKPQEVSLEVWEDRTIGGIFRITLDESRTQDLNGNKLYFASGARSDLEDEGKPIRFTTDMLDSVILESASSHAQGKALDYLLRCWKRVAKLFKTVPNKNDPKHNIVKEARRLCFSYCIFAATMPDMFGEDPPAENALADHLLLGPEDERGICFDFLHESCTRLEEDETVKEALVGAMEDLSRRLATVGMNGDYRPYMMTLRSFLRFQPLVAALSHSTIFLPTQVEAQNIERMTLLGPYFALSPLQNEVAMSYFASASTQDKGLIANAHRALRMTLSTHQDELLEIANHFIKNKESREAMLNWFALAVNKNHKRRALQVDYKTVSSDAFMVNITVTLDRLCEPFMDATFSKIDRIDIDYLRRSPRIDIKDETKINADQQTSDDFYNVTLGGTNNFISEVFFLAVAAHHYGTEAANAKLSSLQKDVKYLKKELDKMEAERPKYASVSRCFYCSIAVCC